MTISNKCFDDLFKGYNINECSLILLIVILYTIISMNNVTSFEVNKYLTCKNKNSFFLRFILTLIVHDIFILKHSIKYSGCYLEKKLKAQTHSYYQKQILIDLQCGCFKLGKLKIMKT